MALDRRGRAATAGLVLLAGLASLAGCGGATTAQKPETAAGSLPAPTAATASEDVVVYIVRHAEKASDSGADPQLSPLGYARARELADLLAGERVDQVIATQYRRTQLTVQPLAERLGLPVEVVEATAGEALAERLRGADPGRRFVVAGHSNTVPDLLGWLGVEEVIEIPDEQYGELFVVRLRAGEATLERRRFGF